MMLLAQYLFKKPPSLKSATIILTAFFSLITGLAIASKNLHRNLLRLLFLSAKCSKNIVSHTENNIISASSSPKFLPIAS